MSKIIFVSHCGKETVIEADEELSIMQNAVDNDVPGIDADCGGGCACATCHVYVDEAFTEKLEPSSQLEQEMLEFVDDVAPNSRLSCQIKMRPELDGIRVATPESQH